LVNLISLRIITCKKSVLLIPVSWYYKLCRRS